MATNKRLSATITIGGAISGTLKAAFGGVDKSLGKIGQTITDLTKRQKLLGKSIQEFGRAGKDVDGMRSRYARLTEQIERARKAQERLTKAQAFKAKAGEIGGALKGAATRAGTTGVVIGGVLYTGIHAAIERENEINIIKNAGLSEHDQKAMIDAASNARQFAVSTTDAFKTIRELYASLGSAHHAIDALPDALKAKSGLQLYNREHAGREIGDDAMYSLAKIADERGGAASPEAMRHQMNAAFKGITAVQGKVSAEDWLTAQRGAKAAGVGMSNDAFFGDGFMIQGLSAPSYGKSLSTLNNAWIGGHQDAHKFTNMYRDGLLQGLGKNFSLKNGLVTGYTSDALVGSKLLIQDQQTWVEKYLVPLAKRKGVDLKDPAAVQKFVSDYTSNPTAGNVLFQRLFNHTAIERDRKNYTTAPGIDESDAANKKSTQGKIDNARARLNDARVRMGNVLLPAFATAMEKTADALERVNEFAEKNPELFKAVAIGLAGTAAALVVVAPVLLAANGILQTIALVRLASATAQVNSMVAAMNGVEGAATSAAGGILGFVGKLAGIAGIANTIANLTTNEEDEELKNGKGKWAELRAKYGQPTIDAARKKYQPWYQIGNGYASENEEWIKKYMADQGQSPAKPPPMATARSSAPSVTSNDTYNISIMQQAGQDQKALADEVMRRMNQQKRVQSRSIMFDGASQ
jgi:hypothetical protein